MSLFVISFSPVLTVLRVAVTEAETDAPRQVGAAPVFCGKPDVTEKDLTALTGCMFSFALGTGKEERVLRTRGTVAIIAVDMVMFEVLECRSVEVRVSL